MRLRVEQNEEGKVGVGTCNLGLVRSLNFTLRV